jgi:hypothetical protein
MESMLGLLLQFLWNQLWLRHCLHSDKSVVSCHGRHAVAQGESRSIATTWGLNFWVIWNQFGRSIHQYLNKVICRGKFLKTVDAATEYVFDQMSTVMWLDKRWQKLGRMGRVTTR